MEAQDTITSKFRKIANLVTEVLFDVLESRQTKNETEETAEINDNGKHDASDIIDRDV